MDAIRAARPTRLYVAADGPRPGRQREAERCMEARRIATAVDWPCRVETLFRDTNVGCRSAVISAIDWFFVHEQDGIVLEDDCVPASKFFPFCAELLERFRDDPRVMAICGSSYAEGEPNDGASYYFSYYADGWGWATWRRAWRLYDRSLSRWPAFKARDGLRPVAAGRPWRQAYWTRLFDDVHAGRIHTEQCWDYQWFYTVIESGGFACYPAHNLVSNIGFRSDATHTTVREGEALPPMANRAPQEVLFPLVHPANVERFDFLERQIEAVRLGLAPPSAWAKIKGIVRGVLGEKIMGMIDYYRFPARTAARGGSFNGQYRRRELFDALVEKLQPVAVVETGADLGATTEFMARIGVPVFAVERNLRSYGYARARLWRKYNVALRCGDSREALRAFFAGPLRSCTRSSILAYLDPRTQWHDDFPLADELEIIFYNCPAALVMIDDFEVPGDEGFAYSNYIPGAALNITYIAPVVEAHDLAVFYPSIDSSEETGLRRGCAVLCKAAVADKLQSIPLLRSGLTPRRVSSHRGLASSGAPMP